MELLSMPMAVAMAAEQEITFKKNIDVFFKETEHEVYFYRVDRKQIVADIIYTDFLPVSKVREILSDFLPVPALHLKIRRKYSYQVITRELYNLFCENEVAILESINGELVAHSIQQLITKRLQEQYLNQEILF